MCPIKMTTRSLLPIVAVTILLGGCATQSGTTPSVPFLTTGPEEPVIKTIPKEYKPALTARGAEVDLNDRRSLEYGLVSVPDLTSYLNKLLDKIKAESGVPNLPGQVYITLKDGPEHSASPDGNIFVSMATIKTIRNEAHAVALLAHELGHVAYGHFDVDAASNLQKQLQSTALFAKKIDDTLAEKRGKGGQPLSPSQEKILKRMRTAIDVTDKVVIPAFAREQERTADRFAIDISRRLGYIYETGMQAMLETVSTEEIKNKEAAEAEQQKVMEKLTAAGIDNPESIVPDLKQFVFDIALEQLGKTHYSAEMRLTEAGEYNAKFYKSLGRGESRKADWEKVIKSKAVASTFDHYELAFEADKLMTSGDYTQALTKAKKAVEKPTSDHAFPQFVLAKAYRGKGDNKNALVALRKAVTSAEPIWEVFSHLSDLEYSHGKRESAGKIMELGNARLGNPPNKKPDVIRFYAKYGQADKVKALELECHASTPRLREQCTGATENVGWGLEKVSAKRKNKL